MYNVHHIQTCTMYCTTYLIGLCKNKSCTCTSSLALLLILSIALIGFNHLPRLGHSLLPMGGNSGASWCDAARENIVVFTVSVQFKG